MSDRRWLIIPSRPPAHTFTPATAGQTLSLCGKRAVTLEVAHCWRTARPGEPRCPDCAALAALDRYPWRVGRKIGRTVYIGDQLVGLMDTPELAAQVVAAVNSTALKTLSQWLQSTQFGTPEPDEGA